MIESFRNVFKSSFATYPARQSPPFFGFQSEHFETYSHSVSPLSFRVPDAFFPALGVISLSLLSSMKQTGIFLFCLLVSTACLSQKEDYVWRLGYNSGIDFNSGTPDTFSLSSVRQLDFTNASTCDSSGSLLFFTNGVNIFNKFNDTLLNGNHLNPTAFTSAYVLGGLPISQAAIIVRRPGHQGQYYIFHETIDNNAALQTNIIYLTVVDMALDSGRGAVNGIKNYHFYENDTLIPGKLSVVKHANGRDFWLVSRKENAPVFYKWLISPDSIYGPFIQSNIQSPPYSMSGLGQVCFSPSGDKYAIIGMNKYFYLYDFDRCTGELTFNYSEHLIDSSSWGNGCAFSPSGRFLYVTTQFIIYQYDLYSANIGASKVIVAVYDGYADPPPLFARFNLMKLGPDGKIYISTDNGTKVLHVIEAPDSSGLACNVQQHSLTLPDIGAVCSVPNIPDYKLGPLNDSGCDTILATLEVGKHQNYFSAFPNPTNGIITLRFNQAIQLKCILLSIKDITGRLLKFVEIYSTNCTFKEMDLSNFTKGIYFITLNTEEINETIRINKQ